MLQELTTDLISEALTSIGFNFYRGKNDRMLVPFSEGGERPGYDLLLGKAGTAILYLQVDVHVPIASIPSDCVVHFCNRWNGERRWPTAAWLTLPDGMVVLHASASVPFPSGASVEQIVGTIHVLHGGAKQFAEELGEFHKPNSWTLGDEEITELLEADPG